MDNQNNQSVKEQMMAKPGYGLAVASFVLGICALACICCVWLAILLGVMAIVFGACGWKYGLGKAGTILGIIAVGIYVYLFIKAPSVESLEKLTDKIQTQTTPEAGIDAEEAADKLISAAGDLLVNAAKKKVSEKADELAKGMEKSLNDAIEAVDDAKKVVDATSSALDSLGAWADKQNAKSANKSKAAYEANKERVKKDAQALKSICGYEFGKDCTGKAEKSQWTLSARDNVELKEPFGCLTKVDLEHTKEWRLIEMDLKGNLPKGLSKQQKKAEAKKLAELVKEKFGIVLKERDEFLTKYSYPDDPSSLWASELKIEIKTSEYSDEISMTIFNNVKVREAAGLAPSKAAEEGLDAL